MMHPLPFEKAYTFPTIHSLLSFIVQSVRTNNKSVVLEKMLKKLLFLASATAAVSARGVTAGDIYSPGSTSLAEGWNVNGVDYEVDFESNSQGSFMWMDVYDDGEARFVTTKGPGKHGSTLEITSQDCGFDGASFSLVDSSTKIASPEIRLASVKEEASYFGSTTYSNGACHMSINLQKLVENGSNMNWDTVVFRDLSGDGFTTDVESMYISSATGDSSTVSKDLRQSNRKLKL